MKEGKRGGRGDGDSGEGEMETVLQGVTQSYSSCACLITNGEMMPASPLMRSRSCRERKNEREEREGGREERMKIGRKEDKVRSKDGCLDGRNERERERV